MNSSAAAPKSSAPEMSGPVPSREQCEGVWVETALGSTDGSLALVNRLDILRREVAHVPMATAPPAQRIRAVNEFDDVAAQEA